MYIKRFEEYSVNESKFKSGIISLLLALGLSTSDAQQVDTLDKKMILKTLSDYNMNPKGKTQLCNALNPYINNPKIFVDNYVTFKPDMTIVVKPTVIPGLEFHTNLKNKTSEISYKLSF